MSIKRQLPPIPKTADTQTRAFFSAVAEILNDLAKSNGAATNQAKENTTQGVLASVTGLTKASLGLGNVDNTSDQNKPVSVPVKNALTAKLDKSVFENFLTENFGVGEWDASTDTPEDIGAEDGYWFKITGAGTFATKSLGIGDFVMFFNATADVVVVPSMDSQVPASTEITAGDGLTGGGDFSASRTIALGVPSTLTGTTVNTATNGSHTHALSDNLKAWDDLDPTGKILVDAPPSSGTYILQSNDGVLAWTTVVP